MTEANINPFANFSSKASNGSIDGFDYSSASPPARANRQRGVFERCYEKYFDRLVDGLHQLHGVHGFDAQDVAHRAFEKLANRLAQTEIHNPEAFVWRVAQNLALSLKRSQAVRQRHASETLAANVAETNPLTPERAALAKEELARVNAALLAMDERRRMIFLLRRIEGLNYTQIAKKLGISRPAVAKHLTKAVAEIDAFLSEG